MINKPLNYIPVALFFFLLAFTVSVTIHYINTFFEQRMEDVIIYEPGDDGIDIMIRKATVIQSEKSERLKKLLEQKQKQS